MTTHLLFSYGTLRQPEVQRSVFGRELDGHGDEITGYELGETTITDPAVIATSGSDRHPILRPATTETGIPGTVFTLTDDELATADAYEVAAYTRIRVPLRSGADAWVYVLATGTR
ncbi:gamma-glutamylcyclotransferase family protein [Nocardia sp. BMG111209]|uniref:gamma-glutamylcyclotransferase family protein n=1 Tax=Nocardia sp. BMG111209 TaxID=1160137 RepID=UPI000380100C|nr:gamma-glutamylcyclotransferase family protein [Nocardia sp. BMG111209]